MSVFELRGAKSRGEQNHRTNTRYELQRALMAEIG